MMSEKVVGSSPDGLAPGDSGKLTARFRELSQLEPAAGGRVPPHLGADAVPLRRGALRRSETDLRNSTHGGRADR